MSGKIIQQFQTLLDEIKADCATIGRGLRNQVQRRWQFSSKIDGAEKPGKFDFDGVHELFDRTEAEENFVQAVETPAEHTRQDLAVAKVQSDIISGMERDFILRHRSRIRRLAHESKGKTHTGSGRGVLQNTLLFYLEAQTQRVKREPNSNGS